MEKTKKLRLICNITVLVLGLLAALSCMIFAMGSQSNQSPLNFSMTLLYILIGLAIALILFFMITQTVSDKKQLISVGLLLIIAIVVILVAYFSASSELSDVAVRLEVSKGIFKWSGALLNMAYIMLGGVIVAFFGTVVYAKLKN